MRPATVYLDYAASTPVDERVLGAMLPFFSSDFGNPSSVHTFGQRAEAALDNARRIVAACIGASPREIIFTGCASESDNLALRGIAFSERRRRGANHILTTPVEHPAILQTARQLHDLFGFELEYLPVDQYGMVIADEFQDRVRSDTALVSVILANNEIGTINPVADLAQICQERGILFHTDAVQAASQIPIRVQELGVDALSIAAHKFYGPKGAGALFRRRGVHLTPTMTGGSQEFGLRPGTHNVPLIVGLAEAFRITTEELETHRKKFETLRDRVISGVLANVPQARLTGHPRKRLPNHASFVFQGIDGNQLLAALDLAGFACSSGSACKTGSPEPSEVLLSIGVDPSWALGSLRVTLGRPTRPEDIDRFLEALPPIVSSLREARQMEGS